MNYPCKNCVDRTIGCHSTCEKYLSVKAANDAKIGVVNKERAMQNDIRSYKIKAVTATKKRFQSRNG